MRAQSQRGSLIGLGYPGTVHEWGVMLIFIAYKINMGLFIPNFH